MPDYIYLLIASGLTMLMGFEREAHGKSAGVRTHMIVGVASCLVALLSMSIQGGDSMRLSAAALTGIGFLGAGVIMKNKDHVEGLTTSAGVWASSAVGIACGAHRIRLAIITASIILIANIVLKQLSNYVISKRPKRTKRRLRKIRILQR